MQKNRRHLRHLMIIALMSYFIYQHLSKYNELNLPENIDVIKNPHFKLPLPNFSQSSPETSAIFQSQSLNNSNETATSQFSITIIERKHSTEDESESNDENYEPNDFQADSGDYHEFMPESLPGIIDEQENKPEVMETKPKLPSMDKDSKKCQDCSIVFLTPFRLQRHIKKFHGKLTATDPRYGPSSSCLLKLDSY